MSSNNRINNKNKQSNLNNRIRQTELDISKNINNLKKVPIKSIPLKDRLQLYSKGFINSITGKSKNNNNNNNNNIIDNKNGSVFDSPIILIIILLISLSTISYGVYKYYKSLNKIIYGKSFYGTDILNYKPLFNINTRKIEECINRCNKDTLCNGITYNDTTLQCLGTNVGVLRDDTIDHQAWVKPITEKEKIKTSTLIGLANSRKVVKNTDIAYPKLLYEFNYSFYIYIDDFYINQGTWKHIFHKGSEIEVNTKILTKNWEDIERDYPDQSVGVWVAPFNNNIRIALTTTKLIPRDKEEINEYKHAYKQELILTENNKQEVYISDKPQNPMADTSRNRFINMEEKGNNMLFSRIKKLEYIDIYRIPIKKLNHININIQGLTIEIYINGNLYKIIELEGYPQFNDGHLYLMNSSSILGNLIDLKYTPARISHKDILEHIKNKESLEKKIQLGIKGLDL